MATALRFNSGPTFSFLTSVSPEGLPLDVPRVIEEVLETFGVDGRRYRTQFLQHRPFIWRTLAAAATFDDAGELAEAYLTAAAVQQLATMALEAGNARRLFTNMHVSACNPEVRPGPIGGAGISGSPQASVLCAWTLEMTDFPLRS